MPQVKINAVCKVNVVWRHRSWSSKTLETLYFDNWEDARKYVKEENSNLPRGPTSDYYIQAEGPYGI